MLLLWVITNKFLKKKILFIIIFGLLFTSLMSSFQKSTLQIVSVSSNSEQVSNKLQQLAGWTQNYGSVQSINYKENALYLTGGNKELFIVNVSDSNNPSTLGSYHNNTNAKKSIIVEDRIFIALQQNGVDIIDIQNESYPELIVHYQSTGIINDLYIIDDILYLANGDSGVEIVDISNLEEISKMATIYDGGSAKKLAYYNNFLFIADGLDGLEVYNIIDVNNPIKTGNFTDGNNCFDVAISNNYALIIDDSDHMKVLDISNKANIQKINEYSIDNPTKIFSKDNFTFVTKSNQILVINCTDPNNLLETTNYNATSEITTLEITDNTIFLSCKKGIEIIQMNSISSIDLIKRFGYGEINEILLSENYIYASMGDEGLAIIDAREPTLLHTKSNYYTSGKIVDVCKSNDLLFVVVENVGVEIIDIQNLEHPIKVGEYLSEGEAKSICVKDNCLFLADWSGGLLAINVSNPNVPQVINKYEEHYSQFNKVRIYEELIYLMDKGGGIKMFDYSRFINSDLYLIKGVIGGRDYSDVAAKGKTVYACADGDLKIYDINDTNNIKQISWITEGSHNNLDLKDDYLYTQGFNTINIFDIKDNERHTRIEYEKINGSILKDIAVEENKVIISNIGIGDDLLLFSYTQPNGEKNLVWPFIVAPIGGIIIIAATVFVIIKAYHKKRLKIQQES